MGDLVWVFLVTTIQRLFFSYHKTPFVATKKVKEEGKEDSVFTGCFSLSVYAWLEELDSCNAAGVLRFFRAFSQLGVYDFRCRSPGITIVEDLKTLLCEPNSFL